MKIIVIRIFLTENKSDDKTLEGDKKEESPDLQPMPTLSDKAEEKVKKKKQERKY